MEGAILTEREAEKILERLHRISTMSQDRRIKEHCRLASCTISKAGRRALKERREQDSLLRKLKAIF